MSSKAASIQFTNGEALNPYNDFMPQYGLMEYQTAVRVRNDCTVVITPVHNSMNLETSTDERMNPFANQPLGRAQERRDQKTFTSPKRRSSSTFPELTFILHKELEKSHTEIEEVSMTCAMPRILMMMSSHFSKSSRNKIAKLVAPFHDLSTSVTRCNRLHYQFGI